MKPKTMSEAVRMVIDRYPVGHEFHGNELHRDVVRIFPGAKFMYTDSIQRRMRRWKRAQIKCINGNKSLYKKVCD
jgi:hypothetical protein